jgi:hypothetical protein
LLGFGFGGGLSLPLLVEPPGVVELVLEPDVPWLRLELELELAPEVSGEVVEAGEPLEPALLAPPLSMLSQAARAPPMARIRAAVERVLRAIRSLLGRWNSARQPWSGRAVPSPLEMLLGAPAA